MTATTYTHDKAGVKQGASGASGASGTSFVGWFSWLFERMIAAQTLRAQRMVAEQLSTLSNSHLKDLGFTDADIARLRMDRPVR